MSVNSPIRRSPRLVLDIVLVMALVGALAVAAGAHGGTPRSSTRA